MGTRLEFGAQLALAIIACLLFYLDSRILFATPLPGIDSYYYLVQERHLAGSGTLYYPCATPLAFVMPAILIFFNVSPEAAWRIGTITALLLLCSGAYATSLRLSRSRARALLSLVLLLASPSVDYLVVEFGKECLALGWLCWAVFLYLISSESGWSSRRFVIFAAVCSAGLVSHSIFILLGASLLGAALIAQILEQRPLWIGGAVAVIFVVSFMCFEFALMQHLSATRISWHKFALHNPAWGVYRRELVLLEIVMLMLVVVSALRPRLVDTKIILIALLASFSTVLSPVFAMSDTGSYPSRLKGTTFLFVAFILPCVTKGKFLSIQGVAVAGIVCFSLWTQRKVPIPPGETQYFMRDRQSLVSALAAQRLDLPSDSVIIASHGTEFLVTYLTGNSSSHDVSKGGERLWLVRYIPITRSSSSAFIRMSEGDSNAAVLTEGQLNTLLDSFNEFERWTLIHRNSPALQAEFGRK